MLGLLLSLRVAATAPYPQSQLITAVTWDLQTLASLRKAHGSDLWPLAWASDGNLYGAWGDGGGFDGDGNDVGRVSLGFARIEGTPLADQPASFAGSNVWGDAPDYAQNAATFGGKVDDLISIAGVLYGQGGLWTRANCGCSDPIHKSGDNPAQRAITWSNDLGKSWHIVPWVLSSDLGASLQFGQDYQGALDAGHVYFYFQRDVAHDPGHIYLRRVLATALTEDPSAAGRTEYAAGVDARGVPAWSTQESQAVPIFFDPNLPRDTWSSATVVYDAAIGRYILSTMHGALTGQIGFFEAPAPWGPWATIAYYEDWGGYNEVGGEGNGLQFPAKWISADGRTLWGVFSGTNDFDSFNIVRAVFTTSGNIPQITAPAAQSVFQPGEQVTAEGVGAGLSWSVQMPGTGTTLASGSGSRLAFTVPTAVAANSVVRIVLQDAVARVYRDYTVASTTQPLVELEFVSTGRTYTLSTALVGEPAYIDRSYPITALSAALTGGSLIQTANDDKLVPAADYLQFTLDRPGTVYVCYSGQGLRMPAWIGSGGWTLVHERCDVSDGVATPRMVYRKTFAAGLVTLGGNRQPPASGPAGYSNYVVIVGP
ncbi:MAG TPA: hypothetical protein VIY54_07685 [Steroidobacteraceae bacterium]